MPSQLTLVTSDRPAALVERLALDLAARPLSPFEDETIVVQSQGMARWVRHELARRHGCAASTYLPFPAAFCHRLAATLATVDGQDRPVIDPAFGRDALTWRILELLEAGLADDAAFEAIRAFAGKADTRKRIGLAGRVAARYDEYQLYRPETLLAWERGDAGAPGDPDVPHARWQAELWRRLCADAPGAEPPLHLARWFTGAIARLESATTAPAGLPPRVAVFGVSTLPPLFVRLLGALARFVPVHAYVIAPPRASWTGANATPNPVFGAFGHSVRGMLALLDAEGATWEALPPRASTRKVGALQQLQQDLRDGVARGPDEGLAPAVPIAADDASLGVHLCHSPMREMEVLRDQLLAAFAEDATLRPHDVLVLVPDIATYAPFVEAVFGVGEPELPRIPHHVADRPVVQESSIADAALRMLRLVGSRCTAAEVVELLDLPCVRRAAGIDQGACDRIVRWIEETRIRWGRDGATRRDRFDLPAFEGNSWRSGIDRLLMGYATGPTGDLVGDVLPHAGDTIGDPATLGAFSSWVERLFDTLDAWREARPLAEWGATLHEVFDEFLCAEGEEEQRQAGVLHDGIRCLVDLATTSGMQRPVDVAVVRDWLERALSDDSLGAGFLVGGMTVCALKPMRSIPFRVIAVAGLDDASFPRRDRRPAFDLMEIDHRDGDRDARADDRQLFLDTILAAGDRLILSYVGRSAKSNAERAVSVVVAELLDTIDRGFTLAGSDAHGRPRRAREAVVTEHRLQPFSPAYYTGESPRLFSYSRVNARAAAAPRVPRTPFIAGTPAAPVAMDASAEHLVIPLADLIDCWANPSRFHAQRVLDVRLPGEREVLDDCEPMAVDQLLRYGVHQEMVARHLQGRRMPERERAIAAAQGHLPSAALGGLWFDRLDGQLVDFLKEVGQHQGFDPVAVEVTGPSWTITGRIGELSDGGRLQVRAANLKARDRIQGWITHLAFAAENGDVQSTIIGRDGRYTLGTIDDALARLDALVAGYRAVRQQPLPVFDQASWRYVDLLVKQEQARAAGREPRSRKDPLDAAREAFDGNDFTGSGDATDAYVELCWRGRDPFDGTADAFRQWSEVLWRPAILAMNGVVAEVPS